MATLPQLTLNFNRQMKRSNDGVPYSLILVNSFSETLTMHLQLKDERLYFFHSNENLLRQKIYQIISGYSKDDAAVQLTNDPVFTQIIGTEASQPSLSHFLHDLIMNLLSN